MSQIKPRPEQVAELTRNIKVLPLPPLHHLHLKLIVKILAKVWNELLTRCKNQIQIGDEPEVTTLVISVLNNLRDEIPEWKRLVNCVCRTELFNYNSEHLEKRSDISIFLTKRSANFPFIIECKLIDTDTGKYVRLYCQDGLARFLNGDYAWYDQQAMMLAYVRDGSTIATTLTPYLIEQQKIRPDPFACEQPPAPFEFADLELACSRHKRRFGYIHQQPPPGPIVIWHVWLSGG